MLRGVGFYMTIVISIAIKLDWTYYEDFKTFKNAIEIFFENFDQYNNQILTLLNFKFGIIKVNWYI